MKAVLGFSPLTGIGLISTQAVHLMPDWRLRFSPLTGIGLISTTPGPSPTVTKKRFSPLTGIGLISTWCILANFCASGTACFSPLTGIGLISTPKVTETPVGPTNTFQSLNRDWINFYLGCRIGGEGCEGAFQSLNRDWINFYHGRFQVSPITQP